MDRRTLSVASLLFGSGACALIYQMAWVREFRLVFGASTAASAAVLGIFMGGLGLGSWVLGRRADQQPRPLKFYSQLEIGIAVSAALTPLLLWLIRMIYIATGGSSVLGSTGAAAVRLLLAALALLVPTFLMGGTLPAAARSIPVGIDGRRRGVAILYGLNTLGAVTGSLLATFVLLEMLGNRRTLWAACVMNALVAFIALKMSDAGDSLAPATEADADRATDSPPLPDQPLDPVPEAVTTEASSRFVLIAALVVGFAFLLMELVWYRMLSPILGGSTFTFGMILAVALLGIGLGGAAYGLWRGGRPATLKGFALTCALEAFFIALPYALGDSLALLALLLRSLGSFGFYGLVLNWFVMTSIVVLPAAFMAGVQFPLLIALLGRGGKNLGRQIGMAYSYNTVGAILGSLAGGFGLLPLLSAQGAWAAVTLLLAGLAVAALFLALARDEAVWRDAAWPGAFAALACLCLLAMGPTAAWRHGGIGAGRSDAFVQSNPNRLREFLHNQRRPLEWEAEGVESSVAVINLSGYSFWVNGKSDGHAHGDAGTQVMGGLIGAMFHPNPKRAMIVGLGTGSTAGWLGSVPSIERVDVVELEPAIRHVAQMCAPVNNNVLDNPKVKIEFGDAREALLTTPRKYDLIFSEPSNPYRAGIASLYTQEFYQAVRKRLEPGGFFMQWVQAYEIDGQTIRTIYATLASEFPEVSTWHTKSGDLVLLASMEPLNIDMPSLRARIAQEPYHSALGYVWRVTDAEGVLAHHIMSSGMTRLLVESEVARLGNAAEIANRDDRQLVEFAFARSVGNSAPFTLSEMLLLAHKYRKTRPELVSGPIDWESVEDQRVSMFFTDADRTTLLPDAPEPRRRRAQAIALSKTMQFKAVLDMWGSQPKRPTDLTERLAIATALASFGDERAIPYINLIRQTHAGEADALLAQARYNQGRVVESLTAAEAAFTRYRRDPWASTDTMRHTIELAAALARADPFGDVTRRLLDALSDPFSVHMLDDLRLRRLAAIAFRLDQLKGTTRAAEVIGKMEPYVPWEKNFLTLRRDIYKQANDPRLAAADDDLYWFTVHQPLQLEQDLPNPPSGPTTAPATQPTTAPATMPTTMPLSQPATMPIDSL